MVLTLKSNRDQIFRQCHPGYETCLVATLFFIPLNDNVLTVNDAAIIKSDDKSTFTALNLYLCGQTANKEEYKQ